MFVDIGKNKLTGYPIRYMPTQASNPHVLMVGSSGSGKTYQLRKMIAQLYRFNVQIHCFDVHGDLHISPAISSTVKFSETSEIGINPFKVNTDLDFGGVRRKVNAFMSMVEHYSGKLGVRQEASLRNLLYDLYSEFGYESTNPHTWDSSNKSVPTMNDLRMFAYQKVKSLIMGGESKALELLDTINKSTAALERELKNKDNDDDKKSKLKEQCKAAFCEYIDSITTGRELDEYIKYDSKDVIKSVYNRIESLNSMGVFKDTPPRFNLSRPVWVYDIKSLTDGEQGFVVETYLEKIFFAAKQKGLAKGVDTFVIIDEAHKFTSKDPDHILNIMAKESRKFGVGLIFASQNFSHFTEDIITSCATKILLGIDEMYHENLSRKLGIKAARLKYIQPQKSALIQTKGGDDNLKNKWADVILFSP